MTGKLHGKLTYANVVATLALVFAMSGGAYAATKIIITSKAQIKKNVLKSLERPGPQGVKGPQGVQGPQGAPGAQGSAGTNGTNGANGKDGVSVTAHEQSTGKLGTCSDGGSEFTSASGKTYACNGQSGFTATLPKGATEKGSWDVQIPSGATGFAVSTISFSIPLEAALAGTNVFYLEPGASSTTECPGSVTEPLAAEGDLCVYATYQEELKPRVSGGPIHPPSDEDLTIGGAAASGALLMFNAPGEEGGYAWGTWAVTAG